MISAVGIFCRGLLLGFEGNGSWDAGQPRKRAILEEWKAWLEWRV